MTHDEKIVEAVATAEVRYDGYEDLLCLSRTMRERYLDRARAAITAYQAEAWQPIETAPKGQVILGYQATPGDWEGRMAVCWDFAPDGRSLFIGDGGLMPTHWQPLPNPPASP